MSKLKILKDRIKAMQEQYDKAVLEQQQKVGAVALSFYEKGAIKDSELNAAIAKIIGEDSKSNPVKTDNNVSTSVE